MYSILITMVTAGKAGKKNKLSAHTHKHTLRNRLFQPGLTVTHPWRPGTGGRGSVEPASLSHSLGTDLNSYPSHPPDEPSPLHTASVKRVSTHKHSRWPKQNYSDPNSPSPTATEANIYEFLNNSQTVFHFRK